MQGVDSRTPPLPPWARRQGDALLLDLHVQPGARRSAVAGPHGKRLKIAIAAPPVEGRANDALLRWLAGQCDCRRAQLSLAAGAGSREKTVRVEGGAAIAQLILRRLGAEAAP
jgi:uncharacterized protein (TIGR00251 family)